MEVSCLVTGRHPWRTNRRPGPDPYPAWIKADMLSITNRGFPSLPGVLFCPQFPSMQPEIEHLPSHALTSYRCPHSTELAAAAICSLAIPWLECVQEEFYCCLQEETPENTAWTWASPL